MAQERNGRAGRRRAIGVWAAVAVLAALLAACSRAADRRALEDTIRSMQEAAQARDVGALMAHVAADFRGRDGLDRDGLRRLLALHLVRHTKVDLTLGPLDMAIEGTRAEVRFRLLAAGFERGVLPSRADAYKVTTLWRAEGGRWRLEYADWD